MTAEPKLTELDWDALGWLMLPPELGVRITLGKRQAEKLLALGFVEPFEETIYGRGSTAIDRIGVRVKGYRMTLLGNLAYCTHLPDDDGPAAPIAEVTKADK